MPWANPQITTLPCGNLLKKPDNPTMTNFPLDLSKRWLGWSRLVPRPYYRPTGVPVSIKHHSDLYVNDQVGGPSAPILVDLLCVYLGWCIGYALLSDGLCCEFVCRHFQAYIIGWRWSTEFKVFWSFQPARFYKKDPSDLFSAEVKRDLAGQRKFQ